MELKDVRVGLRVEVPLRMVHDTYPWKEPYGTVIEIDSFMGNEPRIRVLLDGEMATVVVCRAADLDYE